MINWNFIQSSARLCRANNRSCLMSVTELSITEMSAVRLKRADGDCDSLVSADCFEASDKGNCNAAEPRWFFDSRQGDCVGFYYGGCNGNRNNFRSYDDCLSFCSRGQWSARVLSKPGFSPPSPCPTPPPIPPRPLVPLSPVPPAVPPHPLSYSPLPPCPTHSHVPPCPLSHPTPCPRLNAERVKGS